MDELIKAIVGFAPTVATLLGGPLAGSIVTLIAQALGVEPNAAAITASVQSDPEVAKERLAYLEATAQSETARWQGQDDQVKVTSQNYKMELERGGFWSWLRPSAGWLVIIQSVVFTTVLVKGMWHNDFIMMQYVPQLLLFMTPPAALAGVYFWNRSQERVALINNGQQTDIVGSIADKLTKGLERFQAPHA